MLKNCVHLVLVNFAKFGDYFVDETRHEVLTLSTVVGISYRLCHNNRVIHFSTGVYTKTGKCII